MGLLLRFWHQSYFIPKPTLDENNLPDQQGKVLIVTGSNAGVGYQLASLLYAKNATVYVAARSEEKAHKAIDQIKTKHPDSKGTLNFLKLDLADLSTIEATANEFLSKESRLDVLWNNAGIMTPGPNKTSAQGYELQYATNVLGPFLFTQLLLPILKRTAASSPKGSVRVSWAGSFAADSLSPKGGVEFAEDGGLKIHSKNGGGGPTEYGVSKAANYLLGREFGRRHGEDGVLHSSFNPGNIESELGRNAEKLYPQFAMWLLRKILLHPGHMGAYTELYAGLSPDLDLDKDQGSHIVPWGRKSTTRKDIVAEADKGPGGKAARLYEWCMRETGKYIGGGA